MFGNFQRSASALKAVMITRMREPSFFTLPAADRWYLGILMAIAGVAFTPWSRGTELGGLPLFAWFMTALMVLAPVIALLRLISRRGPRA